MHIKDISIKTRLIISNILMLIIPCSLVVIITAVIFTGFVYRFDGTDVRTQLTDSLGSLFISYSFTLINWKRKCCKQAKT